MKNQKFFLAAGVAVLFMATFLVVGVRTTSAQYEVSDKYYNAKGKTVYRGVEFTQRGCEPGSVSCIDGIQQGKAGDLGIAGVEFYNEQTRGLVEIKTLGPNEVVAYDGDDLDNIWLPNCHIDVNGVWKKRPNRLKRVNPAPPIVAKPSPSPEKKQECCVVTPLPACVLSFIPSVGGGTLSWTSSKYATSAALMGQAVTPVAAGSIPLSNLVAGTAISMMVEGPGGSAFCSITVNPLLPPAVVVENEDESAGPCDRHQSFLGKLLDIGAGIAGGGVSGRLVQGKWGWASGVAAGTGGVVGYFKGPCWGAGIGAATGTIGFIGKHKIGKNPLSGQRGGRENGTQVIPTTFVPAVGHTPNPVGPPRIISVTPIGSGGGTPIIITPPGGGGGGPRP